jgi:hypothetical protein
LPSILTTALPSIPLARIVTSRLPPRGFSTAPLAAARRQ